MVPASYVTQLEVLLAQIDGLWSAARIFETKGGTACNYPILSDETHGAAIIAQNSISTTNQDLTFTTLAFGACPMWRSNYIAASVELVDDANFDIGTIIAEAAAVSFARGCGAAFTATLLSSATSGVTTAATTSITPNEIFDLLGSVDEAYATRGSFLMKQSTLIALRKLVSAGGGQFVFPEARDAQGYPTLLGHRVYISPSMGPMTAGEAPIAFGDLNRFVIRRVAGSLEVKIFVERAAEKGQLIFESYWRLDSGLLKSSTVSPVTLLVMHASGDDYGKRISLPSPK